MKRTVKASNTIRANERKANSKSMRSRQRIRAGAQPQTVTCIGMRFAARPERAGEEP
jgi:hypothetical protein